MRWPSGNRVTKNLNNDPKEIQMPKEAKPESKPEVKPEEHITPEQYEELVKLFEKTSQGMFKLAQTMAETRSAVYKIVGREGYKKGRLVPLRYKKSAKQATKEILAANRKTMKDVEAALAGTLPVEAPRTLALDKPLFTGKDLGLPK